MTNHGAGAEEPAAFDKLMNEVMASAKRFGHREHIYLTWLAIREFGVAAAVALVSEGIQRTARYAGAPQKYNATVSRAWVELVGHHTTESPDATTLQRCGGADRRRHPARRLLCRRRIDPEARRARQGSPLSGSVLMAVVGGRALAAISLESR